MGKNESIKWLPVLMIGLIILINSGCTLEDLTLLEPAEPEGGREEDLPDGPIHNEESNSLDSGYWL